VLSIDISSNIKLVRNLAVKLEARQLRAWEMLSNGNEIKRMNENLYRVKCQSGNGFYLVGRNGSDWICECPDHKERQVACKHIYAVYFSLNFREHVTAQNLNLEITAPDDEQCANCGSKHIQKWGWKY